VANQQKCENLNLELDVIATTTLCRDSASFVINRKYVTLIYEKLVMDNILVPNEKKSANKITLSQQLM